MIGVIPCAGKATRIHGIPKYLLPIPGGYLLDRHVKALKSAGCASVTVWGNPHNIDLLEQYTGSKVYTAPYYRTMTETVLNVQPLAAHKDVLFAMPDTYIEDEYCYSKLTTALTSGADVAVGLFRARAGQHKKAGMCRRVGTQVVEVVDKPESTDMVWLWGALAWQSVFWAYMRPDDPHVGYALPRAIAAGLDVRAIRMDGNYFDCGTYEEYAELTRHLNERDIFSYA